MHDQLLLILENAISSKIYTHQILLNFRPCIDQRSHPNVPTQHSQHQVRLCPPHSIRQCQLLQLCYCVVKSYTTSAYLCCNLNSCFSLSSFTSAITMFPNLSAVYMFSVRSSRFFFACRPRYIGASVICLEKVLVEDARKDEVLAVTTPHQLERYLSNVMMSLGNPSVNDWNNSCMSVSPRRS